MASIDLSQAVTTIVQAVPVWTFVGVAVKYWIDRSHKAAESFKESIDSQFKEIRQDFHISSEKFGQSIQDIQASVEGINLTLASSGVHDLNKTVDELKEAKIRTDIKMEAMFRNLDDLKTRFR